MKIGNSGSKGWLSSTSPVETVKLDPSTVQDDVVPFSNLHLEVGSYFPLPRAVNSGFIEEFASAVYLYRMRLVVVEGD